ncbi:MAG TPA: chromosome assembly protein [Methanothermococcus okinawensis]|uniref:Chromosome assembly protein n=1 Tax=Methanothermococcus okinawensis TaxID=155863 RepID=A0A832ZKT5_9EURY|nr:chromosome assembly protein [Methanococcaceae archaeon]HIP83876.1 chromosome assembly protein [Methanothermococcus okinawensis]HIP91332.1 chromosome assembly protein [Methanothermococcus okinawensis]
MGFWDKLIGRFQKNPLEKLSIRDLEGERIRLKSKLDRIKKEIKSLDRQKRELFKEGVGADTLTKKMLAQDIKSIEVEMKLKYRSFQTYQKQFNFVNNLLIVKKYEKELKNIGMWNKIKNIPPELLEAKLRDIVLDGKEFDETVENLNRVFEMRIDEFEEETDGAEKKIFEAWGQVERGEMDSEDVVNNLNLDVDEEDRELFKRLEKESK